MPYRWMAILTAAAGWATLHTALPVYDGAGNLYRLDGPQPFSGRVLPALLAHPLVEGVGMTVEDAWWCIDFAACAALLALTLATLRPMLGERPAAVATWALLPVLGMAYLAPHRWAVFYPYDLPACAFVAAGLYLALRERYGALALLCIPAALNRETALMLPLAAVALHPAHWRRALPALAVVLAVRLAVPHALADAAGGVVDLTAGEEWRPGRNWRLLTQAPTVGPFLLLAGLGWLPLAWAAVWRDIPADLRRLGWVSLAIGAGMLVVGNVDEPRVFAEALVLAFVPVAVGVLGWVRHSSS